MSTHMAGTWMSEGITKGLSVQTGMTVAKSQTHASYTIRFVCFNQWREHVAPVAQRSAVCLVELYKLSQQGEEQL